LKSKQREIPCLALVFPNFHSRATSWNAAQKYPSNFRLFETPRPSRLLVAVCISRCTKNWHPPVDDLHSIENKRLKIVNF
jgi:hypothetical protein